MNNKKCSLLLIAAGVLLSPSGWANRSPLQPLPSCQLASINDDILADGLGHNSFDSFYRSPTAAVPTTQPYVNIRFRTCQNDVTDVRLRIWNTRESKEEWIPMSREPGSALADPILGPVEFWIAKVPLTQQTNVFYYFFEISDSWNVQYYNTDPSPLAHGGWGRFTSRRDDFSSWGITVFDSHFKTPEWFKGSVMYHILPDRFRNGDPSNDQVHGEGFVFGKTYIKNAWSTPICDPRGKDCNGQQDNQFYGGDLQGVIEKLDYLHSLGVQTLYFNPIFLSSTNHRYDTQDYFAVDPELGTEKTFETLVDESRKRGMKVILDGVFNHGSADSPYFDLFRRWEGLGACESLDSPSRDWFYFPHFANTPVDHARPGTYYYCLGQDGMLTTYEAWWSYYEHPVYRKNSPVVRDYFFSKGTGSVGPYWIAKGAGGWRLDVGGDVAPGEAIDPKNDFWQGFRKAIKKQDPEAVIIGEEWGSAVPFVLGNQWDATTNYRFRALLLDWLTDNCQGLGCSGGRTFEDDDNNWNSPNGAFASINEQEFVRRLTTLEHELPPEAWHSMMNPLGSHDTQRALFVLKKISGDDETLARRKLALAAFFQFTYPGVPVIYYGDEAGVAAEGKFYDGKFKDDPYNRAVYPWSDQGLQPNTDLLAHFSKLGAIRRDNLALRRGTFEPLLTDNSRRLLAFRRKAGDQQALIILNRDPSKQGCLLPADGEKDGARFRDAMTGEIFESTNETIRCNEIPGLWGRILIPASP